MHDIVSEVQFIFGAEILIADAADDFVYGVRIVEEKCGKVLCKHCKIRLFRRRPWLDPFTNTVEVRMSRNLRMKFLKLLS